MCVTFLLIRQKLNWTDNHGSKSAYDVIHFYSHYVAGWYCIFWRILKYTLLYLTAAELKFLCFQWFHVSKNRWNDTSCCKMKMSLWLKLIGLDILRAIPELIISHRWITCYSFTWLSGRRALYTVVMPAKTE